MDVSFTFYIDSHYILCVYIYIYANIYKIADPI